MFRDVFKQTIGKAERGFSKDHIQLLLLRKQTELLRLDRVGWIGLNPAGSTKHRGETDVICGLSKLDGSAFQDDLDAVTLDHHVLYGG